MGALEVDDASEIMMITSAGIVIRMRISDISILGRITSGVKLVNMEEGTTLVSMTKVRETPAADTEPDEEEEISEAEEEEAPEEE